MKLRTLFAALLVVGTAASASAQNLGEQELQQLKGSFVKDAQTVAVQNVLMSDKNIKNKTLNKSAVNSVDHFFKYRVDVKGITDQQSSGRCWMFTSMNALRPIAMEKYNVGKFDFSHNYSFFWDMLEKANLYLENIIRTADKDINDQEVVWYLSSPVGDGGVWNLFYNIGEKYGVVPKEVMPETEHSNNTSQMRGVINRRLKKAGWDLRQLYADKTASVKKATKKSQEELAVAMKKAKMEVLEDVYRVLALCLGEPPVEFTWKYKNTKGEVVEVKTTPEEFYKSLVPDDYNPQTYIMIMNDPTREYYKVYDIQNYRNTIEGVNWVYLNLPNEDIKEAALKSIKANEPLYASCDVGKESDTKAGVLDDNLYDYESLLGIDLKMDKKARILTRYSGSAHAMLIVACDTDENDKPVKWEFENSWGAASGHNGYLTFTDKWFDEYMFRIVINKKYLNEKALEAAKQTPVLLPAWDYMW
ncbi:MAG: C1 family peptidase [Bacteroidales bacterium]|nr:C1 family peptidase [Bacteroidales bacterium]